MINLFNNAAKDAKKIHDTIDYRVIKASWDYYIRIRKDVTEKNRTATPAWYALFSVQNHNGKFNKFETEELPLLKSITSVQTSYNDIIKALEEKSDDRELAIYILETHPNLTDAIPHEYDNPEKINGYLVKEIKKYQKMLADFYKKYKSKIDNAIKFIEKQKAKGIIKDNDAQNFHDVTNRK